MTDHQRRLMVMSTSSVPGGMERVAISIARQMAERGWSTRTLFAVGENPEQLRAWAREQGAEAEPHPGVVDILAPHPPSAIWRTRELVRSWKPTAVNIHYGGSHISIKDIIGIRLAGRHAIVANVHLPAGFDTPRKARMTRLAASMCTAVVTHSRQLRDMLVGAGIPASRIRVIPNGIRPPAVVPRPAARAALGLGDEAFVVGVMARLHEIKGIDVLLEAMRSVDGAVLLIAGDGPERCSLEAQAARGLPGRARFIGLHTGDPGEVLAALDVLALPSRLEGFPVTLVEAAFCGVPSVATDVGGVRELVEHGVSGLVVPPEDSPALAAAIRELRADPALAQRLGAAARAFAATELTESAMGDRYQTLFRQAGHA